VKNAGVLDLPIADSVRAAEVRDQEIAPTSGDRSHDQEIAPTK
jgi:hypothetical protein